MNVYLAGGVRTPIGKILGNLSRFRATDLGALVLREAVHRAGIPEDRLDEVIVGNVIQAGNGQSPGRIAAVKAGLPPTIPAFTVNKVCGSGLKAVMLAAQAIKAGDARVVLAGGMESMTHAPHAAWLRGGVKYGHVEFKDLMLHDGLWCAFNDAHMGNLAEYTARKAGISREEQDRFALESHQKAIRAIDEGAFKDEILPVTYEDRKQGTVVVDTDETPRRDTSLEKLAKLPPAFEKDGTVTAGNAPPLSDGAAAILVLSEDAVNEYGVEVQGIVRGYAAAFREPKELFFAPIDAIRKLLAQVGWTLDEVDLFEINEAFAAQILADGKELGLDWSRVNVHGGAIALGHPIGASGTRILVTLLYAMKRHNARKGVAALCLGGGGAVAMAVERP